MKLKNLRQMKIGDLEGKTLVYSSPLYDEPLVLIGVENGICKTIDSENPDEVSGTFGMDENLMEVVLYMDNCLPGDVLYSKENRKLYNDVEFDLYEEPFSSIKKDFIED